MTTKFRLDLIFTAKCILNLECFLLSNAAFLDQYIKNSPEFCCAVARYAVTHGARPTARKYKLTESAVREFVKCFKKAQSKISNTDLENVSERKRGRSTLIPEEIDHKVMVMVKKMRQSSAVINYSIIIAFVTEIIMANDRTLLKENGGTIGLMKKWCELND